LFLLLLPLLPLPLTPPHLHKAEDWYTVAQTPAGLMKDVLLLPFLACGGFMRRSAEHLFWMSSGGTRSVVHTDAQDNMNCVFAGTKRVILWNASDAAAMRTPAMGWADAHEDDKGGYGQFFRDIDIRKMDVAAMPQWADFPHWEAKMEAGDCLFIPTQWHHHVTSTEDSHKRNIGVNIWWFRNNFVDDTDNWPDEDCAANDWPAKSLSLARCTWGVGGEAAIRMGSCAHLDNRSASGRCDDTSEPELPTQLEEAKWDDHSTFCSNKFDTDYKERKVGGKGSANG